MSAISEQNGQQVICGIVASDSGGDAHNVLARRTRSPGQGVKICRGRVTGSRLWTPARTPKFDQKRKIERNWRTLDCAGHHGRLGPKKTPSLRNFLRAGTSSTFGAYLRKLGKFRSFGDEPCAADRRTLRLLREVVLLKMERNWRTLVDTVCHELRQNLETKTCRLAVPSVKSKFRRRDAGMMRPMTRT